MVAALRSALEDGDAGGRLRSGAVEGGAGVAARRLRTGELGGGRERAERREEMGGSRRLEVKGEADPGRVVEVVVGAAGPAQWRAGRQRRSLDPGEAARTSSLASLVSQWRRKEMGEMA